MMSFDADDVEHPDSGVSVVFLGSSKQMPE
jgi:hypothetical protein